MALAIGGEIARQESMRASRLISMLLLLQARGRMTAQALADEFGVSVRTIYRDIDELSSAEVPVYADRGRNGGFELLDGYRTKLTGLSSSEAATLFLTSIPGPIADLGLSKHLQSAQLKLLAALPERSRMSANQVSTCFHVDVAPWFDVSTQMGVLPDIAEAVLSSRYIDLEYQRQEKLVSRRVAPFGLVLKAGAWYLVGKVDNTLRTYRVGGILSAKPTEDSFQRPAEFSLEEFWRENKQQYEQSLLRETARIRLTPRGLSMLGSFWPSASRAVSQSTGAADEGGAIEVKIPIESIDDAAAKLMQLGAEAKVLDPSALRVRLADQARAITTLYGEQRSAL